MGRGERARRGGIRGGGARADAGAGGAGDRPGGRPGQPGSGGNAEHRRGDGTPACRRARRLLARDLRRDRSGLGRGEHLARGAHRRRALHQPSLPGRGRSAATAGRIDRAPGRGPPHLPASVRAHLPGQPVHHRAVPPVRLPARAFHRPCAATPRRPAPGAGAGPVLDLAAGAHDVLDRPAPGPGRDQRHPGRAGAGVPMADDSRSSTT